MAFKLPTLKHKFIPSFVRTKNIPQFALSEVQVIRKLGDGTFGEVFLGETPTKSHVVLKRIKDVDSREERVKRLFYKEATILHDTKHANIVKLLGLCYEPCCLLLEYMCFDFAAFDGHSSVSTLADFLTCLNDNDIFDNFDFQVEIASQVSNGLAYLHELNVAHRDLKPANVLVSNQHYCHLDIESVARIYEKLPIICKLTDFGESRSDSVQTATLCNQRTVNVCRGSPVYMAPEIFNPSKGFIASLNDLKAVDVWALGMVFFMLLNPDLDHPFSVELRNARGKGTSGREIVAMQFEKSNLPTSSPKYQIQQASDWLVIEDLTKKCLCFNPRERVTAQDICEYLKHDDVSFPCRNITLKCSQSTAAEQFFDLNASIRCGENIPNDGTNSCAFLSVLIMDKLISEGDDLPETIDEWEEIAESVADIITNAPSRFNHLRDISKEYDAVESYNLLTKAGLMTSAYEFSEEFLIVPNSKLYSQEGRSFFLKAVRELHTTDDIPRVAVYTCGGYAFIIGCKASRFFIVDTHCIRADMGGNGNGMIKVFPSGDADSARRLCSWIWKRLRSSNVKNTYQSLAVAVRLL